MLTIPYKFNPRPYQIPFLSALDNGIKRHVLVWHRRSGKEKACLNAMIKESQRRKGGYYYMFPELKQGRRILWDGIDKDGTRFLDHIPNELIESKNDQEMKIVLKNGSVFNILGSDQYNSNVGSNPVMIVFSEYSLCDPNAWGLYRPILAENDGIAVFNFTPRGENHAFDLYNLAMDDPKQWFAQRLTVDDTNVISKEVLEQERKEIIRLYGNDALFKQEYYCDFTVPIAGAYYADQISNAYAEGRVTRVVYEPKMPVYTYWDLGINDTTAIWYLQKVGNELRLIDYSCANGKSLLDWIKEVKEKNYLYADHYAPHDIKVREFTSGKSRWDTAKEHGILFRVASKLPINEGIEAVRQIFSKCWFDHKKCKEGIEALKSYHKEYDESRKCYNDRPYHDWSSNGADAFRYLAASVDHRTSSTSEIETILRNKRKAVAGWINGNFIPQKPVMH
jgi:phage terminase large subunit